MMNNITLHYLWNLFAPAIYAACVGALIGHMHRYRSIILPTLWHNYKPIDYSSIETEWRFIGSIVWTPFHFILYFIGIRTLPTNNVMEREISGLTVDLGFIWDLIVGVGAGILARCSWSLADSNNLYSLIAASLLAGFAGMEYILSRQNKHLDEVADSRADIADKVSVDDESDQSHALSGTNIHAVEQLRATHRQESAATDPSDK